LERDPENDVLIAAAASSSIDIVPRPYVAGIFCYFLIVGNSECNTRGIGSRAGHQRDRFRKRPKHDQGLIASPPKLVITPGAQDDVEKSDKLSSRSRGYHEGSM
jgi:hypothetical protein